MGQALYRKYRPKTLSEIIGQEHITQTLGQALEQGKISHAYLFIGPRGIGKTSIARILAHEINGLPYTDEATHMDIIEIDAASNRRIDEIRELRDKVYVAPTSAKYKVYIIDEVHMLTREAFNALLKTLEEPPAHAVFILATTDAHKLPDTIVSRTQRYSFKPVPTDKVAAHLRYIADAEKIDASDAALELLAKHGEGSFRDSISLLDQASGNASKLELVDIQTLLGIPSDESITRMLELLTKGGSSSQIATTLNNLYNKGFQAVAIAKQLSQKLREMIIYDSDDSSEMLYILLERLIEVPTAHNSELFLEIVLLRALAPASPVAAVVVADKTTDQQQPKPKPLPKTVSDKSEPHSSPKANTPVALATPVLDDDSIWPQILQALKQKHNTLYGVVRMAHPAFTDDGLVLTFEFAFHQKRINEAANRQMLINIIQELTGKAISVECVFDKKAGAANIKLSAVPVSENNSVSAISNIFGGGELLES